MAEGAGVPFADLFRLNVTELNIFAEKCTTLIFPLQTPNGRKILIAHNEDWDPRRNDVFILKAKMPGVSYLTIAYNGYLPGVSSGINSFGLIHALNFVRPRDLRSGLSRIFITRHMVTAPTLADALRWIRNSHRAFGQTIHLAQGSRYIGLELTARQVARLPSPLPLAHTNHYVSKSLLQVATPPGPSTAYRLAAAAALLNKNGKKIFSRSGAARLARHILSDRSRWPYSIWREFDSPKDPDATVAAGFFGTDLHPVELFRRTPSVSQPLRIRVP